VQQEKGSGTSTFLPQGDFFIAGKALNCYQSMHKMLINTMETMQEE